ncbi:MAG: transporter associated domain-containing protein [bacterium]|nr:transporter associated domain-containing protein [bacterium]
MDELLNALNLHFDELNLDSEYEAETLSYFITSYLERFPSAGEIIRLPLSLHEDIEGKQLKELSLKILWVKKNVIGEISVLVEEKSSDS